jgi:hypothetical protein
MALASVASLVCVTTLVKPAVAAPAKKPACPTALNDEASALLSARLCGGKVEVAGDLSETTEVWANPNGTLSAQTYEEPQRVQVGGKWAEVDLTLVKHSDGTVTPKVSTTSLTLTGAAGAGSHDLVSTGTGDNHVALSWNGVLPAPVLSGTTATYTEVRPGIDLVIEATRTGFEQHFVVKTKTAAALVADLSMAMRSPKLTIAGRSDGGLAATDQRGRAVGASAPPTMWDQRVSAKGSSQNNLYKVVLCG